MTSAFDGQQNFAPHFERKIGRIGQRATTFMTFTTTFTAITRWLPKAVIARRVDVRSACVDIRQSPKTDAFVRLTESIISIRNNGFSVISFFYSIGLSFFKISSKYSSFQDPVMHQLHVPQLFMSFATPLQFDPFLSFPRAVFDVTITSRATHLDLITDNSAVTAATAVQTS